MKKLLLLRALTLTFILSILLIWKVSGQETYYWYFDKKIPVSYNKKIWSIESPSADKAKMNIQNLKAKDSNIRSVKPLNNENLFRIDFNTSVSKESLKTSTLNGEAIPSLVINKQDELPILMTGKIVAMPNEKTVVDELVKKFNLQLISKLNYGALLLKVSTPDQTLEIANAVHESGMVKWCTPDFYAEISAFDDPYYRSQFYVNSGLAHVAEVWAITRGSSNIRIAVVDDGVEDHEDLGGRVLSGFTPGGNNTLGRPIMPREGHGECCAGIIAATHDNSAGIKGIAPLSQIIPVKVLGDDSTYYYTSSEIASAITWAYQSTGGNADILSNSWGSRIQGFFDASIAQAITDARTLGRNGKGSVVVFSSGNANLAFPGVTFPGNVDGVITVGAGFTGGIYDYSSRGPEMDLIATSSQVDLKGTLPTTDRMGSKGYETGNYTNRFGGTSAACPQVAGVAALMLSVNPNLTEAQVRTILQQTATDMGTPGFDNESGYGHVNALSAVMGARSTTTYISGKHYICNSEVYNVVNLPAGATVTWSVPSNITVLTLNQNSPAANQLTIVNLKGTPIKTTLTATITVGTTTQVCTLEIENDNVVGVTLPYEQVSCVAGNVLHPAQSGTVSSSTATFVHMGCDVSVTINNEFKTIAFEGGSIEPLYWNFNVSTGKLYFALPLGTGGVPFNFRVERVGDFGGCSSRFLIFAYANNTRVVSYKVAPNPAKETLDIYVMEDQQEASVSESKELNLKESMAIRKQDFQFAIKIFDLNNQAMVFSANSKKGDMVGTFDISSLKPGPYCVNITDNSQTKRINFIKQ